MALLKDFTWINVNYGSIPIIQIILLPVTTEVYMLVMIKVYHGSITTTFPRANFMISPSIKKTISFMAERRMMQPFMDLQMRSSPIFRIPGNTSGSIHGMAGMDV